MTESHTPIGVARRFDALTDELAAKVAELNAADRESTRLKGELIKAYSIAWQQVSGSVEAKRQVATRVTIGYRVAADDAACEVRCLQREVDLIETRVGTARSYGAAVRAEVGALGPWTEG